MKGYEAKIVDGSREFSKVESLKIKMLSGAIAIDDLLKDSDNPIIEGVTDWAELQIHNENSKQDKDYSKYVVLTENGDMFITGSESFWDSFRTIYDTMNEGEKETFSVQVYAVKSTNFAGEFFNCAIV